MMMGGPAQNGMLYMLFCVERPPVSLFVAGVKVKGWRSECPRDCRWLWCCSLLDCGSLRDRKRERVKGKGKKDGAVDHSPMKQSKEESHG